MHLHLFTSLPSPKVKEDSLQKIYPDEIIPHLFLGNAYYGQSLLKKLKTPADLDRSDIAVLACSSLLFDPNEGIQLDSFCSSDNYKKLILTDSLDEDIAMYFLESYQFIEKALINNKNVFVYCSAGVSRSATIVIAYLQKKYSLTFEQAFNHVIFKRPCINPNKNYIAQLETYHPYQF